MQFGVCCTAKVNICISACVEAHVSLRRRYINSMAEDAAAADDELKRESQVVVSCCVCCGCYTDRLEVQGLV